MKKTSRRLLIIPPTISFDFDGKIAKLPSPENSAIFELEVVRVRMNTVALVANQGSHLIMIDVGCRQKARSSPHW